MTMAHPSRIDPFEFDATIRQRDSRSAYYVRRKPCVEEWAPRKTSERFLTGPFHHKGIEQAIRASDFILELEDNWDGEGSTRYKRSTWDRMAVFLRRCSLQAWQKHGEVIPVPVIGPGPNGSIDLHWKTSAFELLINVPSDSEEPATFYGDDYGKLRMEGTLVLSEDNRGLLQWLTK